MALLQGAATVHHAPKPPGSDQGASGVWSWLRTTQKLRTPRPVFLHGDRRTRGFCVILTLDLEVSWGLCFLGWGCGPSRAILPGCAGLNRGTRSGHPLCPGWALPLGGLWQPVGPTPRASVPPAMEWGQQRPTGVLGREETPRALDARTPGAARRHPTPAAGRDQHQGQTVASWVGIK